MVIRVQCKIFCIVGDLFVTFFFFKQKTAYEMRISDWSSDVCSSDLRVAAERHIAATLRRRGTAEGRIGVPYRPIGARGESRISPESRHAVAQLLTISAAHAIARPL